MLLPGSIQNREDGNGSGACGHIRIGYYHAYQLAVVVDDEYQGVTEVVRGADLIESTTRQIALQKALGYATPNYMHLPVALASDGKKLSKRFSSDPVGKLEAGTVVLQALRFLGQHPPDALCLKDLWAWAMDSWDRQQIPPQRALPT